MRSTIDSRNFRPWTSGGKPPMRSLRCSTAGAGWGRPIFCTSFGTSLTENLAQLAEAVLAAVPDSGYSTADLPTFNSILRFIGGAAKEKRLAIVLDEFQYLVEKDPSLPSQIQAWGTPRVFAAVSFWRCADLTSAS